MSPAITTPTHNRGLLKRLRKDSTSPKHSRSVDAAPRLRLALANIYHQCDPIQDGNGVWTDTLDNALREAAEKAYDEGHAMLLFLHTWVLPSDEEGKGILDGADRLLETVKEESRHRRALHGAPTYQPYPDVP